MKIKPVYVLNFSLIIIILAVLFTPFRKLLEKIQSNDAQSEYFIPKTLSEKQYDIDLKGINTSDINLRKFKGKKIFLHFWGTWCPICVKEMPQIQKLYNEKGKKYQFVLIYMKEPKENVLRFLQKNSYTFPVYDANSSIETSLLPTVFPTTFLIDEKGNITDKIEGEKDWSNLDF